MYYILTEDTGSGFLFYNLLNEKYLKSKFKVVSVKQLTGATEYEQMLPALKSLLSNINYEYRFIFLAFDTQLINSSNAQSKDRYLSFCNDLNSFISNTNRDNINLNKSIRLAEYFCFEALMLELRIDLYLESPSGYEAEAYKLILDLINGVRDLSDTYLNKILKVYSDNNMQFTTFEQVAAHLLTLITTVKKNRNFTINKNRLGDCWGTDCCDISCKECYNKHCRALDRLKDVLKMHRMTHKNDEFLKSAFDFTLSKDRCDFMFYRRSHLNKLIKMLEVI